MKTMAVFVMLVGILQAEVASQLVLHANLATEAELLQVPHMTPALATTILERRPFKSVRDLDALLQSLSRQQRSELYGKLFVPINLNAATDVEILTIPGMGQRMLREFKEYRPYRSIEQFRREIGKYVSGQEVARLERYVTIN